MRHEVYTFHFSMHMVSQPSVNFHTNPKTERVSKEMIYIDMGELMLHFTNFMKNTIIWIFQHNI